MDNISGVTRKRKRGSSKWLGKDKGMKKRENLMTDTPKGGDARVPVEL